MKCPYDSKIGACLYIDTAAMDKKCECPSCPHFVNTTNDEPIEDRKPFVLLVGIATFLGYVMALGVIIMILCAIFFSFLSIFFPEIEVSNFIKSLGI